MNRIKSIPFSDVYFEMSRNFCKHYNIKNFGKALSSHRMFGRPSRKRSREEEEETGPRPSSVKSRAQQYERMLSEKKAKEGDTPQSKGGRSGAEEEAGPPPVPAAGFLKTALKKMERNKWNRGADWPFEEPADDRQSLPGS
ncbi:hypothetical protein HNY73_018878 [Argiope bruennichi]|uniref:Uncharacterized protein n=1 Tax=Argiope bruennichi TaxID=94029 RepID=A0A8T0EFG8_ARGBR|nr:hypothetical protein HNY73_018878 [Argiope bruennichi]